jgi:chemotaxis signal transduction protein
METATQKMTLLTFLISGSYYSLKTTKVAEVIQQPNLVYLPTPIQNYSGVIYYNGDFIPILDLHKHLINGPVISSHNNSLIIIRTPDGYSKNLIAVLVDEIKDVITIEDNRIFNIRYSPINANKQLLQGVYKYKNKLIHLIDIESLYQSNSFPLNKRNESVREIALNYNY